MNANESSQLGQLRLDNNLPEDLPLYQVDYNSKNHVIGNLTLLASDDHLLKVLFEKDDDPLLQVASKEENKLLKNVQKELDEYFAGSRQYFQVALGLFKEINSPLAWRTLNALMTVKYGEVITYEELAERAGTDAIRACASWVGKNPLPIILPCHRIIPKNAKKDDYGNYGGGRARKRELLSLEAHNENLLLEK